MSEAFDSVLADRLARLPFALNPRQLLERDAPGDLAPPGRRSANGHCGLFATQDGWVAVNLARGEDIDLVPALTGRQGDPWAAIEGAAASARGDAFVARATELQMPAAVLGEACPATLAQGPQGIPPVRVLDLSVLWAGPLCAALLARGGAEVRRVENPARPDPTPLSSPRLDRWLNGGKTRVAIDLSTEQGRARLMEEAEAADVLVTSARAGALARLGLDDALFERRPRLVWAAITAHGWAADRVGFGDDCAVAGGLVGRDGDEPSFMGDGLADPLTGLEAALAVAAALGEGRGGRLDLAMSGVAAAYAEAARRC